jgi:carbamate kinase
MKNSDAMAKAAALFESTQNQMREMSENPDLAKGTIGTVVLALIRLGEEVSTAAIVAELEAAAAEVASKTNLTAVLARGALKVISNLRPTLEG